MKCYHISLYDGATHMISEEEMKEYITGVEEKGDKTCNTKDNTVTYMGEDYLILVDMNNN